ncbi:2-oxoglutarate dehydrogenase E1 component [Pedomonas mirosovicensis]|uniref:2-oxoglutarate dehydrogenase E1 component n=1 Tax=Pedomonas mirosovicensis TaxID=2908641 RepID=UPI002166C6E3|nr:2-oxoglutarate dehydrogenase E1 component [Pedomonas mirosovicensis]MCH8684641.1 2-oxoglutarate dehydrogenase E1 component [Pedomonas mirosovicensis]
MGYEGDLPQGIEGASAAFIEALYEKYQADRNSVDPSWQRYFAGLELAAGATKAGPSWQRSNWPLQPNDSLTQALDPTQMALEPKPAKGKGKEAPAAVAAPAAGVSAEDIRRAAHDTLQAFTFIRVYRVRGHLAATLDPLGIEMRAEHPELQPSFYGFGPNDMDRPIYIGGLLGFETATIRQIHQTLCRNYCGNIALEYMHINDIEERRWLQERFEGPEKDVYFTAEGKLAILNKLIEAESFEKFLARKYVGTKRFGLDGGESLIPAMESVIKVGGALGVEEIVIGMPHRGRLNVLTNVMQKPFRQLFHEFAGGSSQPDEVGGSGDVKYHLGTSTDRGFDGNMVHLSLTPNPSHLETVNPVVLGRVRAKQTQRGDKERTKVLPVLLHGDAAFAGQGVVAECFAMSGVPGYNTGGTIHFIVNNQVGFTTSPKFARSSPYPSDVAKMVQAPIFHVNGDDPEAVVYATKIATEFRQTFKRDVVIDMWCYRRFGHNEADEPGFTQPKMYAAIKSHPFVSAVYTERLKGQGVVTDEQAKAMEDAYVSRLEDEFEAAKGYKPNKADWFEGRWSGLHRPVEGVNGRRSADTGVAKNALAEVGKVMTTWPESFKIHRTLERVIKARAQALETGDGIDWATAEQLAFGTLLKEGFGVRLSGQDVGRGTFSHRHAVFTDQETEEKYIPLTQISPNYEVYESVLSEYGVMGYEYGFSLAEPNWLTLWEAQFGDFANGAQIIIDQYLSSSEVKWLRASGLVLLLPHGYEGQGPEHSSARLERYLQLCAEDNMQVANCTTPANYFHILRRQLHRAFRKPLVMMTPKSLLRHKKAISRVEDFLDGTQFHRVLPDDAELGRVSDLKLKPDNQITRLVLCTGKVYYDLLEERDRRGQDDTYILRVEQLYPFPAQAIGEVVARFPSLKTVVWAQEEPKNMGAWSFINPLIEEVLVEQGAKPNRPVYAGRAAAAATATGFAKRHAEEQARLVADALDA